MSAGSAFQAGCGSSPDTTTYGDSGGSYVPDGSGSDGAGTPDGTTGGDSATSLDAPPPGDGGSGSCGTSADPSTLGPSCCTTGNAHCVEPSLVPANLASDFSTCMRSGGSGLCVPDEIIAAGTAFTPTTCSFAGAPGVCLSTCIEVVASNPDVNLLSMGTCAMGDLCVPCTNPLTMMSTGACEIHGTPCTSGDAGTDGGDAGDAGDTGTTADASLCPYTGPPLIDPTQFPACTPACGGAHCVPAALVPAAEQSELAACGSGATAGFCAPDTVIASDNNAVPATCTSIAGAEGRCLSVCLPEVASKILVLPQATCASDERCTPCYDPTSDDPRMPTGACSVACDSPKEPPVVLACPYTGPPIIDPSVFPACAPACAGAHCVPSSFIPTAQQGLLATCPGGFCAPDSLTSDVDKAVPETCTSVAGSEGRCLSPCIPEIGAQASLLPQDVCPTGLVCAPCYNPTASDPTTPTGACSLACDVPQDPPTILSCPYSGPPVINPSMFPACSPACGGAHCVPAAQVPASQQSQLATCPGGFCTPDPIVESDDNYVPPSCTPFPDPASEGRCTSDCLPAVEAQASQLTQGPCAVGDLCAPCNDPFSGDPTGACTLACDSPKKPTFTFPLCCDYNGTAQGTCVPSSLVPSGQASNLLQDECPDNAANYLCVPDEDRPNPTAPQETCVNELDLAGTCISDCVNITFAGVFGQDSCPPNHKCVPCILAGSSAPGCE